MIDKINSIMNILDKTYRTTNIMLEVEKHPIEVNIYPEENHPILKNEGTDIIITIKRYSIDFKEEIDIYIIFSEEEFNNKTEKEIIKEIMDCMTEEYLKEI